MRNAEIADAFEELGDLYELDGAVVYRVLAYRNAAKAIRDSAASVEEMARAGTVVKLPGIGKTIADLAQGYFSTPAPRRAFFILAGKKLFKPIFELLGNPLRSDAQGHISDVPFALYWLELLTRLGLLRNIPSASRVLARLFNECDEQGIWSPKSLRTLPKVINPVTAHYFPLEGPGKSPAQRQTDVTFRLALIARLMGLPIEIV